MDSPIKMVLVFVIILMTAVAAIKNDGNNDDTLETNYDLHFPLDSLENPDGLNTDSIISAGNTCNLTVSGNSIKKFHYLVYLLNLNFVYLNLTPSNNVTLNRSPRTVGKNIWVWTFNGKDGAVEFLKWPLEFGIWSFGFLSTYVYGPMPIMLERVSGDCSNVTIGERKSDRIVSQALVELVKSLMNTDDGAKYGPSLFCFKKRIYINPQILYTLCKHIVCPLEALEYSCCSYYFDANSSKRKIACSGYYSYEYHYDTIWWAMPAVVAVILLLFFPLLLLNIAYRIQKRLKPVMVVTQESISLQHTHDDINSDTIIFYNGQHHVTLFNTIFHPVIKCCMIYNHTLSRILRFLFPFLSLSAIALEMLLDHVYLRSFVLVNIKNGVPLGFRSMLAGYSESKTNFLPYSGGPFVAIAVYVVLSCILTTLPNDLSEFLNRGLPEKDGSQPVGLLVPRLRYIELYGNIPLKRSVGYLKIYNTLLAQFYMLMNRKFWKFVVDNQRNRWDTFCSGTLRYLTLPFYILICCIELVLCLIFNGLPIFSFFLTVFRAYCFFPMKRRNFGHSSLCSLIILFFAVPASFLCILIFIFMFCTIFLDACLFLTRIFIFTYTGVVVFPKASYGYILFCFTVVFYLWMCLNDFALMYDEILKVTIKMCRVIQNGNHQQQLVFVFKDLQGIRQTLFDHVIEKCRPRRKMAFLSLLKLYILLSIIGLSMYLLTKMEKIHEIHIFMHVTTALFTCALPQIFKSVFLQNSTKFERRRYKKQITLAIREYIGEISDGSHSELSD